MPGGEPLDRGAAAEHRSEHVDGEDALPALEAHVLETRLEGDDPGIVDEPGEPPHPVGGRKDRLDIGFARDVTLYRDRFAAIATNLRRDRLCRSGVARIVHHHAIARRGRR